jgi:hypothetical protein
VAREREEAGIETIDSYRQTEFSFSVVQSSVWFGKKANQMTTFMTEDEKVHEMLSS